MNTLFNDIQMAIHIFRNGYSLEVSKSFIECADKQLTELFIKQTGLHPGNNVSISIAAGRPEDFIYSSYVVPNTNYINWRLHLMLYINHNWNPITIYWKCKSIHKCLRIHQDIDCNDTEFWFEGLDPILYHKQLYPNIILPFKLKDLTYELVITTLNMDMTISMALKKEEVNNATVIMERIDKMMDEFNNASLKKDRKDGIVHNWKRRVEDNNLLYDIDTGSAGMVFLKKLLQHLSKLNYFYIVEVS